MLNVSHAALQEYGTHGLDAHALRATTDPANEHDHKRFRAFEELASCLDEACIGGPCGSDTSKVMCGLAVLNGGRGSAGGEAAATAAADAASGKTGCVVYSIGGNNQWEFEMDILARTTCEVHTFDCTGAIERFIVPKNGRLHFHHECLHGGTGPKPGPNFLTLAEMTHKYNHTQIDLFKMDIEGFEWGVFDAFYHQYSDHKDKSIEGTADNAGGVLPMQMLVEVHYQTQFKELFHDHRKDWKFEEDVISLARNLFAMGYIVVKHDDNAACKHCVELTLVRAYC